MRDQEVVRVRDLPIHHVELHNVEMAKLERRAARLVRNHDVARGAQREGPQARNRLEAAFAVEHGAEGNVYGEGVELDTPGLDGVDKNGHAGRVEAALAQETGLGEETNLGSLNGAVGGWLDVHEDKPCFLGDIPLMEGERKENESGSCTLHVIAVYRDLHPNFDLQH